MKHLLVCFRSNATNSLKREKHFYTDIFDIIRARPANFTGETWREELQKKFPDWKWKIRIDKDGYFLAKERDVSKEKVEMKLAFAIDEEMQKFDTILEKIKHETNKNLQENQEI